jgi:hypothetical protein
MLMIQSFGQILIEKGDTLSCYNSKEVKQITKKIIQGNECNALLKLSNEEIHLLNDIALNQKQIIKNDSLVSIQKEEMIKERNIIIENKNKIILDQEKEIKKQKRNKFILSGIFISTTIYFIIK